MKLVWLLKKSHIQNWGRWGIFITLRSDSPQYLPHSSSQEAPLTHILAITAPPPPSVPSFSLLPSGQLSRAFVALPTIFPPTDAPAHFPWTIRFFTHLQRDSRVGWIFRRFRPFRINSSTSSTCECITATNADEGSGLLDLNKEEEMSRESGGTIKGGIQGFWIGFMTIYQMVVENFFLREREWNERVIKHSKCFNGNSLPRFVISPSQRPFWWKMSFFFFFFTSCCNGIVGWFASLSIIVNSQNHSLNSFKTRESVESPPMIPISRPNVVMKGRSGFPICLVAWCVFKCRIILSTPNSSAGNFSSPLPLFFLFVAWIRLTFPVRWQPFWMWVDHETHILFDSNSLIHSPETLWINPGFRFILQCYLEVSVYIEISRASQEISLAIRLEKVHTPIIWLW
jgi:hypothetical protein